jgi:hypothetical protein
MNFTDKPNGNWQFRQPLQTIIHRAHIVQHFAYIAGPVGVMYGGLRFQQIVERRLRSFDLAGKNGFLADIHENEHVGVG